MTQAERRELMLYHASLIVQYISHPPGDGTQLHQREADRANIIASVVRLHELAIQLEP